MTANVLKMPGIKELPKTTPKTARSVMDTLLITLSGIERWKKPPFQRDLRLTPRVHALVAQVRADGVVPGIITLGKLHGETFLIDGQHRIEAFRMACDPEIKARLSEDTPELAPITEGLADVRICHFDDMGEMGEEFVTLNSALVRMRNDDILRGLEGVNEHLATIRKRCPFVGYGNVRMKGSRLVVAMAAAIRVWFGSEGVTPTPGPASTESARMLNDKETDRLCQVLKICHEAWGNDPENYRLWGTLNLALVFWLWRRLVLQEGATNRRGGVALTVLTPEQFRQCLMALSANQIYVEWLLGRAFRDRDRSPAYTKIKSIFAGRLGGMGFGRPALPIVEWASH